jgi:hypothetical protein
MATVKLAYGTSTALTCTLANLGTGTARTSEAQDNSGGLFVDAMVTLKLCLLTGAATGNSNAVHVYFYGSEDGVNFTDNVTGTDAGLTLRSPHSLVGPHTINFATATGAPVSVATIGSVAAYFDGTLPRKWGICVVNKTNTLLNTGTTMTASWTPIYLTVA